MGVARALFFKQVLWSSSLEIKPDINEDDGCFMSCLLVREKGTRSKTEK